jgi:hypothetical protein
VLPIFTSLAFRSDAWSELEDAAILALQPLLGRRGRHGPLEVIKHHNGELVLTDDEVWRVEETLLGRMPAILVQAGAGRFKSSGKDPQEDRATILLELWFLSANLRGQDARTGSPGPEGLPARGDHTLLRRSRRDPGVYQVMRGARALLRGRDLQIDNLNVLHLQAQEPAIITESFTSWRQVWAAELVESTGRVREVLGRYAPITQVDTYTRVGPGRMAIAHTRNQV